LSRIQIKAKLKILWLDYQNNKNNMSNFNDFLGMQAAKLNMTREEYTAYYLSESKPGPKPYHRGLDDDEIEDKKDQIKKQSDMDDNDSSAYKEMPGDKEAREKGEVKTSKHVKKYHELYGDKKDESVDEATFRPNSGTMSGGTYTLDNRKYKLKKDIEGVQIGNYTNIVLPKGTIIYNIPGGVFADHPSLKRYENGNNKYFNKPTFKGISIIRKEETIFSIDKNSKILESVVTEAKAYKLKASEFGGDTHSSPYNVKGEPTWRVHSTYAIDQVSGENDASERDVVFFEAMPINNDIYIKIGGINNLKRTGSTVGDNFGTTIEEWKKDPKGIAKEASDFLTDATHLKWINKKARSEGQVIKWALKDDYSSVIEDLVNKSLGLSEGIYAKQSKIQPGDYIQTQYGYFYKRVEGQVGGQDAYVEIKKGKEGKKKTSIHDTVDFNIVDKSIALDESQVTEKREDVGKYNTVKKVIAKIGRRPSEQELATFITKNYYDVTEVERGEDDPAANDKIADLVGFYKFDIDDWNIAWFDAQNESVKTFKYIKPLNEYYGKREHDDFEKEFGKIKYPKWIKVKMKELVDGQFIDKLYAKPYNYMSLWLNQMGKRKFNTDDRKKELGEVGYKLTDRYWHDLTGHTAFKLEAAEAAMEVSKHIQDMVANKEEVEPSYYLMKNYFNTFGMQTDRSRIFNMAVEILDEWMAANAIETL